LIVAFRLSSHISLYVLEIATIHSTLDYLIKEVRSLKQSQSSSARSGNVTAEGREISASPEPPRGRDRRVLEQMSKEQFKAFRV
jgi:hypothetical protein